MTTCHLCEQDMPNGLAIHLIWDCPNVKRNSHDQQCFTVVCPCGQRWYVHLGGPMLSTPVGGHYADDKTVEEHMLRFLADEVACYK